MTKTTHNIYQATIPGYENCTWITYKIVAYDNAGNQASEDNSGLYYTYHVIPEIPSIPILLLELLLPVILLSIIKENQK